MPQTFHFPAILERSLPFSLADSWCKRQSAQLWNHLLQASKKTLVQATAESLFNVSSCSYGWTYLGKVTVLVRDLKEKLQEVRERQRALRKGESANEKELDEYFDRLDALK